MLLGQVQQDILIYLLAISNKQNMQGQTTTLNNFKGQLATPQRLQSNNPNDINGQTPNRP